MEMTDLSELLSGASEGLSVEYKSWMDTTDAVARANLARHIAALANYGGGYLIFGVDDKSRRPQPATGLDPKFFGQETLSGIIKRYLDPRVQVQIETIEFNGVAYPIVIVPAHGSRPIIAIADGPHVDGKPRGINLGAIYIRSPGPESVIIRSPDDWNHLLERCLSHRADLLAKILRQSLAKPTRPSPLTNESLIAAIEETAKDFSAQAVALAEKVGPADQARVRNAGSQFCVLSYALMDDEGELIAIENPRTLNSRVSIAMHRYAYDGWSLFLPLSAPERAPQLRTAPLLGTTRTYLEGMRLRNSTVL